MRGISILVWWVVQVVLDNGDIYRSCRHVAELWVMEELVKELWIVFLVQRTSNHSQTVVVV